MSVTINVDRDGWTGLLQVSIGNDRHGYRLAGPKYNGSSETLLAADIDAETAERVAQLITGKGGAVFVELGERVPRGGLRVQISDADTSITLAGGDLQGPFRRQKRAVLDDRDVAEVLGYLAEVSVEAVSLSEMTFRSPGLPVGVSQMLARAEQESQR